MSVQPFHHLPPDDACEKAGELGETSADWTHLASRIETAFHQATLAEWIDADLEWMEEELASFTSPSAVNTRR